MPRPGVQQHELTPCPEPLAVRDKVECQLAASCRLAAGTSVPCSAVWLTCAPHRNVQQLVCMLCLAAMHAFGHGRKVACWATIQLSVPSPAEQAAMASSALLDALAELTATARVLHHYKNHRSHGSHSLLEVLCCMAMVCMWSPADCLYMRDCNPAFLPCPGCWRLPVLLFCVVL